MSEQIMIPALGHKVVIDAAVPATHVTTGLTEGSRCAFCGEVRKKQTEIPKVEVAQKMVLPSSLTAIEAEAFAGNNVVCVVIPEHCTEIGASAFADCAQLRFIEIPASVTSIDDSAFDGCSDVLIIVTSDGSAAQRFAKDKDITCVLY